MEFPNIGARCSVKECGRLDFLPIICTHCSNVFCNEHFYITAHSCLKFITKTATGTETTTTFCCSEELCSDRSLIELQCSKCKNHFCLSHRTHNCIKEDKEKFLKELQKRNKTKQDILQVKTAIDLEIINKLRKSKNSTMANKVQLMRLKAKSVGSNNIPISDRRYFLVHPPVNCSVFSGSKAVFVSTNWSIGKIIDSVANSLKVPNSNNVVNVKKLRMYHYLTGNIVSNQMDVILSELLNSNIVLDGQDIILEYSNDDNIDCSLYK